MQLQKWVRAWLQTYSTRLAIGLFLLVVATTLSAGVPAYWLTHVQLNQQVATHLRDSQQSTLSLLSIEHARLANVAFLFAERPTLAALLNEIGEPPFAPADAAALSAYIANFQQQIGLDLLLICAPDPVSPDPVQPNRALIVGSPAVATDMEHCPINDGFLWVGDRATLVAQRPLITDVSSDGSMLTSEGLGRASVMAGVWLDQPFMDQLAAATGMEQSLLDVTGQRLVSSLDGMATLATERETEAASENGVSSPRGQLTPTTLPIRGQFMPTTLQINGHTYSQLLAPLPNADDQVVFYSEILLNADALFATRNRVLGILLFSTGVVASLGVALGVWSIRRVTSPLASLTAQAERISQGEFETPIPPLHGPVEVQTLAAALRRSQASIVQALVDLAAARDRLDNLVQSLVEGVVIINEEGKITFWNQAAAMITGWPAEQAFGKELDLVLPLVESHQPTLLSQLPLPGQRRRVLVLTSGGRSSTLEVTSVRSTGGDPRNATDASPGGDDARAQHERALVLRDVTEEEATRHLRAYFLANISHEFRTPLSTLNASMELLMDESEERADPLAPVPSSPAQIEPAQMMSGAEMRALLKPIHLSLLELQMLIDNLLEGSTIEAGEFRLRKRTLTLSEPIQGALTVVQPVLERRQQTLSVTVPPKLEPIWADRVRLTQVLVNLLVNASKYTPMGEAIDIKVVGLKEGGYRVMVADRGPGIPEVERVNLFRRFVRLDSAQNKAGDQKADVHGTGIGLHVVKTAIEAHEGRVGIEDRKGGGSVFWFEIPRGEMPK